MINLIFILPLIGSVCCFPSSEEEEFLQPEWRGGEPDAPIDGYQWGYFIPPTRGHMEQRGEDGVVTGMVSFENAKGNYVRWTYSAHPEFGFRVRQYKEYEHPPGAQPIFTPTGDVPSLKSAQDLGIITQDGFENEQVRYKVDDTLRQAAGSESQLAHNLGAVPAAAIHDGRGPPSRHASPKQTGPVLLSERRPGPYEDSKGYVLLIPEVK